jgi:hypothetical protein
MRFRMVEGSAGVADGGPKRRTRRSHAELGSCVSTTIAQVTTRLEGIRDSGTAVIYADGHAQVSYDRVPSATRARRGDTVRLCAIEVPFNCPPKDFRGVVYQATDLRRHLTWTMRNAEHGCWGA